ncbi:response regulator transcription factor [Pararhodonellum marinum]|uniref:response regulator transcription factor n=1 Tax=Pararhodonellum marinum TaxID=2755358 RepID=UPI00188E93A3|nr:response regulator transcription factor [Pararhodonellum marinum]
MIGIVLADDHKMFAKGIANLLDQVEDLEVLGIFQTGGDLLNYLENHEVDLVLTDMNMPGIDGLGVIQEIRKRKLKCKIIVLSMYDEEEIFKKCIKQGIDAYVLKDADPDELIYTIHEVLENNHIISFDKVLKQAEDDGYFDAYKLKYKLSKREIQIIRMLKQGKTNKEIADDLYLSVYTVETHRKNMYKKLGINSSLEFLKIVLELDI